MRLISKNIIGWQRSDSNHTQKTSLRTEVFTPNNMILFLLPLLFSPFNFFASWLPTLYLAVWPILIKTAGRETLVSHALVLILFILTCDITRQTMLKLIGFDLISLPVGIALLAALVTDKGTLFLSYINPLFSGLLVVVEPFFLIMELYLVMDMIRTFNQWLSEKSNVRDEDSHDLATWDPPLARESIVARFFVILITLLSYIGIYMIIQESKSLLALEDNVPVHFNHAIAALVTLQLIAFSATVYKEEGILSESALVALMASIPILIASWSYHHLKEVDNSSASWWTSYFPFSIFSSSSASSKSGLVGWQDTPLGGKHHFMSENANRGIGLDDSNLLSSGDPFGARQFERGQVDLVAAFEESIKRIDSEYYIEDTLAKQLLLALARRLIMLINSILGLSFAKLASFYFGPDICYILAGRLGCLFWLAVRSKPADREAPEVARISNTPANNWRRLGSIWPLGRLPLNKWTLIKLLLVLAYTQTLIQQMDNRQHLLDWQASTGATSQVGSSCCAASHKESSSAVSGAPAASLEADELAGARLRSWFSCMWTSAKACHHLSQAPSSTDSATGSGWARRLIELLSDGFGQLSGSLLVLINHLYALLEGAFSVAGVAHLLWLARWRSPIVQRLMQSMLVQVYYIARVLSATDSADGNR